MADTVMILPDMHCPCMKKGFIDFLKKIADAWSPTRIVHIGDLVDNCAYSFHQKPASLKDPLSERKEALGQIRAITKAFPKADMLIGNHDDLTQRQAVAVGLDPGVLRSFSDYWELPSGWTIHPRYDELEIDGVLYYHGDKGGGGVYAAANHAKAQFQSVVIGHFHGNAGVHYLANSNNRVFGMSVGCGVDGQRQAMEYGRKYVRKPILGCGIVTNGKQGYFEPWLLDSRS